MKHRPWSFTARLVDRMADSSLQDQHISIQRPPRSAGLHASELLKVLHPHDEGKITEDELRLYALLGFAFEDRVETALLSLAEESDWPFYAERPGEVEAEGIACSPDILLVSKEDGSLRELSIKATWKSCRGLPTKKAGAGEFPPKFDYYMDQCMTYGVPLNTLESVLLVYFVCGDYSKPFIPQVYGWELEFSKRERAETWQALTNVRKQKKL